MSMSLAVAPIQTLTMSKNNRFSINPFKPEFTIVIFIRYKSRIAAAILDL